jgi:precorrin-4 methylase
VCEEWHSLENFVSWAHSTYPNSEAKLTLDRIDNNRNYEPDNCRWATSKEQMNNRRNTKIIEIDRVTKSLSEWCEEYDMPVSVVYSRINTMGWNADKALSTPIQHFDERGELIEINGALKTIKEWCEMYHISRSTVYGRKRRGMDIVSAITLPTKR